MQLLNGSRSSLRHGALWLVSLAACLVPYPISAAAPVVVGIDGAAYGAEVSRLQREIEELLRDADAKEKAANADNDPNRANGAADSYAKAAGRFAQQYFMNRATGRTGANEEVLVRRYVRHSYALQPDRGPFLNPQLALAREQAIAWLHEHGVESDLAADSALLERAIELLPDTVFVHCAPVTPCPTCPTSSNPHPEVRAACPVRPASRPEPTPVWQRLGIELSQVVGASIHRGEEGYTFTHRVLGARVGLFGQVWQGSRAALDVGGSYVFKVHRIGVPPVVGDTVDLPSLLIYEHSIAAGPRFRLSLPTQRVALHISASLGLSLFNPFVRSDGSAEYSDSYYKGPKLYGEGIVGLLLAHDILSLNLFISGARFSAEAQSALGTSPAHGLGLGGSLGIDLIRLISISRKLRKTSQQPNARFSQITPRF